MFRFHPGSNLHWLVLCDHASNRVPAELSDLGLSPHELGRHTAWDIGAGDVARRIARGLGAPLIEQGVSRLVIDANRGWGDDTLIPRISDGTRIPGNQDVDETEKRRRWELWHRPYHRRIERHLNQMHGVGLVPFVVSIHSFTPQLGGGEPRPWPIGILWRHDPTLAHALIRHLGRDGELIGDNRPYDGHVAMGYTVEFHAIGRALPYTMVELRQDQLATPSARRRWACKVGSALEAVVGHFRRIR